MINGISCYIYEKKNPKYLLIQPVNEPHAQMLDQQVQFMESHTEKSFLLVSVLVYLEKKVSEMVPGRHFYL